MSSDPQGLDIAAAAYTSEVSCEANVLQGDV